MSVSLISGLLRWVRLAVVLYLGVLVLVTLFQRKLIYFPSRGSEEEVVAYAKAEGLVPWRNARGDLIGFHSFPRETARSPVLVFHGNAGFAAHRSYFARLFRDHPVFIVEYPGYGARDGKPKEATIKAAAEAALGELVGGVSRSGWESILVVGESIGSGPATWLAGRYPDVVRGVLLITPFTSLVDVAASQFPFLPVRILLRERWDNVRHLAGYPGPVGILLAAEDSVVPARFGRELHDQYEGKTQLWTVAGADHNTIMQNLTRERWRFVVGFLETPPD